MRATIICFIIIIMVLVTTNLNAVEPFNAFWKSRQSRQQEARDWRDGFMKLNEQIPTLSPAEQHWLKTEIDDEIDRAEQHYTKRAHDAMNSREFDLRMAKPHVEEIMRVLSDLSRPTILDQRTEVILWAKLASLFMDYEFWQAIEGLIKRGVVKGKINSIESNDYLTYTLWAKYIVNEIVLSHLNGNLGK